MKLVAHTFMTLDGVMQGPGGAEEDRRVPAAGFPVTVGAGKRLFTDDAPPRGYSLLESRTTRAGAVYQVLAPKAAEAGGLTVRGGREAAR